MLCVYRTTLAGDLSVLAMQAFRVLVEYAPRSLFVQRKAIFHFPTLSILLKTVQSEATDPATTALRTQLALTLSLMCSIDPLCRERLRKELAPFPVYVGSIKKTLLQALSDASLEVFAGIKVVDVNGYALSARNIPRLAPPRAARAILRQQLEPQAQATNGVESGGMLQSAIFYFRCCVSLAVN